MAGTRAPKLPRKPVLKPLATANSNNDAVTSDKKSRLLAKEMKHQQQHQEKVAQWTEMYNAISQVCNILLS